MLSIFEATKLLARSVILDQRWKNYYTLAVTYFVEKTQQLPKKIIINLEFYKPYNIRQNMLGWKLKGSYSHVGVINMLQGRKK